MDMQIVIDKGHDVVSFFRYLARSDKNGFFGDIISHIHVLVNNLSKVYPNFVQH